MSSFDTAFQRQLVNDIVKLQAKEQEWILAGAALGTHAPDVVAVEYARRVGYLAGLADVLRLCEQVHGDLQKA